MAGQKDTVCGLSQYLSQNSLYRSSEEGKYIKEGLKRLLVFLSVYALTIHKAKD